MPTFQQKTVTRGVETLLLVYGTPDQIRTWRAGDLHEEDLLALARRVAFLTFEHYPRYRRLEAHEVEHAPLCRGEVAFDVVENPSLMGPTFRDFVRFGHAAERSATSWGELAPYFTVPQIANRIHVARCPSCLHSRSRASVLVTVTWSGRVLSREYQLGGEA